MNSPRAEEVLVILYDIAETVRSTADPQEAAAGVLEVFTSRLRAGRGMIGLTEQPGGPFRVLAAKGATETELLRDAASLHWACIPGTGEAEAKIGVERLPWDHGRGGEAARFLEAAAALLPPLFSGEGAAPPFPAADRQAPSLGGILRKHIASWIEPMDTSRRLKKSDVFDRLISEVEKVLIGAALEKTGFVQTEAARFLGINRNTLSKKIKRYGLEKKGE